MELKLIQLNNHRRKEVLEKLGYSVNQDGFVSNPRTKKEVVCKYTKQKVHINTAAILPGSVEVINATPLSMAQYFIEHEPRD